MKSILLSIQPKWVEKILNGEKIIEIRKVMPNCELPIDVYIYQTKGKWVYKLLSWLGLHQGKVVAKFTLNKVDDFMTTEDGIKTNGLCDLCFIDLPKATQLSLEELQKYIKKDDIGYAWHIDNLVIFDKPKELKEFKYLCKYFENFIVCSDCCGYAENSQCKNGLIPITKAPQSFCYCYLGGEE